MSNTAICHISITLNIKFDREKDLRDTKNCQKCNFEVVWTKLWRKIVFSDSFLQNMVRPVEKIKYIRTFMENLIADFVQFSCTIAKFVLISGTETGR